MKPSIFDPENWREIGATLARNKTRTFLTAFGIFWGTAMLAMLWGGARGFEGVMMRNFAGLTTNLGGVFPAQRTMSYKGFNKGTGWALTFDDVERIKRTAPAMEYCTEVITRYGTAAVGTKSVSGNIIGVGDDYTLIMSPEVYSGRLVNATDIAGMRKVAVVGRNLAANLFGAEDPIGKNFSINGVYFQCIGIAGQLGEAALGGRIDDSFMVPSSTMQLIFNTGNKVTFMVYTAPAGHSPKENQAAIMRILSAAHSIHPDDTNAVSFLDFSETFSIISALFLGISMLALFIGIGSLMAGVIGVGNIMWIIVKERTQEFGIRRAIGARPIDITVQVLSESIVLTLVAGIAGVSFATVVLGIADTVTMHPILGKAGFSLPFTTAAAIVVIFFILGSAAGTLPAIKAMKISPIEAIRDK